MVDPDKILQVLTGVQGPPLEIRSVSREVNRVDTNGPQLIEPLPNQADRPLQLALAS